MEIEILTRTKCDHNENRDPNNFTLFICSKCSNNNYIMKWVNLDQFNKLINTIQND